jgi:hypothetical protein
MFYYQGLFDNGTPKVFVQQEQITKPLPHLKHHSDTFAWGYAGSGPADLARSLLSHHMGVTPPNKVYQAFKGQVIAAFDQHAGWVLQVEEMTAWCEEYFTHHGKMYEVTLQHTVATWEAELECAGETLTDADTGMFTPLYGVAYALLESFTGRRAIPVTTIDTFAAEVLVTLYEECATDEPRMSFTVTDVDIYRWFRTHAHQVATDRVITPATSHS